MHKHNPHHSSISMTSSPICCNVGMELVGPGTKPIRPRSPEVRADRLQVQVKHARMTRSVPRLAHRWSRAASMSNATTYLSNNFTNLYSALRSAMDVTFKPTGHGSCNPHHIAVEDPSSTFAILVEHHSKPEVLSVQQILSQSLQPNTCLAWRQCVQRSCVLRAGNVDLAVLTFASVSCVAVLGSYNHERESN